MTYHASCMYVATAQECSLLPPPYTCLVSTRSRALLRKHDWMLGCCGKRLPTRGLAENTELPIVCLAAGFLDAVLRNESLVWDLAGRPVGRAPPPGVLEVAEEAGLNTATLKALLRECGEDGCAQAVADMLELHSLMARDALGLPAGAAAVVTNGRAVLADTPLADEQTAAGPLTVEDFFLMQLHAERAQYGWEAVGVVQTALEDGRCRLAEPDEDGSEVMSSEMLSDAVMVASSVLAARSGGVEPRSIKLAGTLTQLAGERTTILVCTGPESPFGQPAHDLLRQSHEAKPAP